MKYCIVPMSIRQERHRHTIQFRPVTPSNGRVVLASVLHALNHTVCFSKHQIPIQHAVCMFKTSDSKNLEKTKQLFPDSCPSQLKSVEILFFFGMHEMDYVKL